MARPKPSSNKGQPNGTNRDSNMDYRYLLRFGPEQYFPLQQVDGDELADEEATQGKLVLQVHPVVYNLWPNFHFDIQLGDDPSQLVAAAALSRQTEHSASALTQTESPASSGNANTTNITPSGPATGRETPIARTQGQTTRGQTGGRGGGGGGGDRGQQKVFCTHWINTGNCGFVHNEKGCRYKHEMPPREVLDGIGFTGSYPAWWIKKKQREEREQRQQQNQPQRTIGVQTPQRQIDHEPPAAPNGPRVPTARLNTLATASTGSLAARAQRVTPSASRESRDIASGHQQSAPLPRPFGSSPAATKQFRHSLGGLQAVRTNQNASRPALPVRSRGFAREEFLSLRPRVQNQESPTLGFHPLRNLSGAPGRSSTVIPPNTSSFSTSSPAIATSAPGEKVLSSPNLIDFEDDGMYSGRQVSAHLPPRSIAATSMHSHTTPTQCGSSHQTPPSNQTTAAGNSSAFSSIHPSPLSDNNWVSVSPTERGEGGRGAAGGQNEQGNAVSMILNSPTPMPDTSGTAPSLFSTTAGSGVGGGGDALAPFAGLGQISPSSTATTSGSSGKQPLTLHQVAGRVGTPSFITYFTGNSTALDTLQQPHDHHQPQHQRYESPVTHTAPNFYDSQPSNTTLAQRPPSSYHQAQTKTTQSTASTPTARVSRASLAANIAISPDFSASLPSGAQSAPTTGSSARLGLEASRFAQRASIGAGAFAGAEQISRLPPAAVGMREGVPPLGPSAWSRGRNAGRQQQRNASVVRDGEERHDANEGASGTGSAMVDARCCTAGRAGRGKGGKGVKGMRGSGKE